MFYEQGFCWNLLVWIQFYTFYMLFHTFYHKLQISDLVINFMFLIFDTVDNNDDDFYNSSYAPTNFK